MRALIDRIVDSPLPEDNGRPISSSEMRALVSRDLETLLNTRSEGARLIPEIYKECRASLLTFGVLDFSSYSLLSTQDRDRIRRSLEQAIGLHESRLSRVRVTLESQSKFERALRFRVDAMLDFGEQDEKVQFDAYLQISSQSYVVR